MGLNIDRRFGQHVTVTHVASGQVLKITIQPSRYDEGVQLVFEEPGREPGEDHQFLVNRPGFVRPKSAQKVDEK